MVLLGQHDVLRISSDYLISANEFSLDRFVKNHNRSLNLSWNEVLLMENAVVHIISHSHYLEWDVPV